MKSLLRQTYPYRLYKKSKAGLANFLYANPSKDLVIIGITGTDGKTTTTNLIHKIINDNLGKCGLISTNNIKIGEEEIFNKSKMTSLDPMSMQKILSGMKESGCKYLALEVSSHGIDQYRFEGIEFDIGVLTNITSEHLDYHKDMESYADTKKRLFMSVARNKNGIKGAVLNKDAEYGRKWFDDIVFDNAIDYGINVTSSLMAEDIKEGLDGINFSIKYLGKRYPISSDLLGKYNAYNILAASGVGLILGIPLEKIVKSIKDFPGLSGRMERINKKGINFFVDFAHTPNALESVLKYLNNVKGNGRIITVFGAPGERDKYKRKMMGEAAHRLSDIVIVTDDDPAGENRFDIIKQVAEGIKRTEGQNFFILPEREFAIRMALEIAKRGDIVLFAGKGHEQVQLTNFGKRPWSDKDKLIEYLEAEEK